MGCEVCGRDRDTEVFSSLLGPFSSALCRECWDEGAEPEWAFAVTLEETGGQIADWVHRVVTWKNGAYLNWDAWIASAGEAGTADTPQSESVHENATSEAGDTPSSDTRS